MKVGEGLKNMWAKRCVDERDEICEEEDYDAFDDSYPWDEEEYDDYSNEAIITNVVMSVAIIIGAVAIIYAIVSGIVTIAKKLCASKQS